MSMWLRLLLQLARPGIRTACHTPAPTPAPRHGCTDMRWPPLVISPDTLSFRARDRNANGRYFRKCHLPDLLAAASRHQLMGVDRLARRQSSTFYLTAE